MKALLIAIMIAFSATVAFACDLSTDPNCILDGTNTEDNGVISIKPDGSELNQNTPTPDDTSPETGPLPQTFPNDGDLSPLENNGVNQWNNDSKVIIAASEQAPILHPVREYLGEKDIPPQGVGAYGIVALKSKPTPANFEKLMMVCKSFIAHFDPAEASPYPASDQMVTIWPLDDPKAELAEADNCDWILQHYVLGAASTDMAYATRQHMTFDGEGPFLIGWSPVDSRDKPDQLVLVVDMSRSNDQAAIDHDFDFWKDQIVKDPGSWRSGFSLEAIRQKIKDFVDHYGGDIVEDIKMAGL